MPHRTLLCRLLFCAVFSVATINVFTQGHSRSPEDIFCPSSALADDVLVVLRTGATSSRGKLPVHFRTTLRCVPNFVIVSDLDEEVEGHAVHDVLGGVSERTRKEQGDFKLYHHLQEHGREGLADQKIVRAPGKGDYPNVDSEGWKLDKWKFLPMIDRAFQERPQAKWFVFIEDDTYLVWNNLLEYLSNFDASKPYYIGKHLYINDIEFGYGGAGLIISNPAMRKVSEHRSVRVKDYEEFTASHWVGDCALGKILSDVKVPLHKAFPHLQGESPYTLDPATNKIDRSAWCYPAVTYHHVSPSEIEELWAFEQDWFQRHDILLRHRDIFMEHVRPQISVPLSQWDNLSADKKYNAHDTSRHADPIEREAWKSFHHCHAVCEANKDCLQYSFEAGTCSISYSFHLGYAKPTQRIEKITSGWMIDRVDDLFGTLESKCGIRDWFGPQEGALFQNQPAMKRK